MWEFGSLFFSLFMVPVPEVALSMVPVPEVSVLLKAYPNGGGTDISFVGQCHAKPSLLVFGS